MKYLTTTEAAKRADKSEATIIRWCKAGHIKHRREGLGGYFVISARSLDTYVQAKKRTPDGYIYLTTASNYTGIDASTLRRMTSDGRLPWKRYKKRLYVHKDTVLRIAKTYDPVEARAAAGRKTAAMMAKPSSQKGDPAVTAAIEKHLPAHTATMARINKIRQRVGLEDWAV